jgi:hypothetical protein
MRPWVRERSSGGCPSIPSISSITLHCHSIGPQFLLPESEERRRRRAGERESEEMVWVEEKKETAGGWGVLAPPYSFLYSHLVLSTEEVQAAHHQLGVVMQATMHVATRHLYMEAPARESIRNGLKCTCCYNLHRSLYDNLIMVSKFRNLGLSTGIGIIAGAAGVPRCMCA